VNIKHFIRVCALFVALTIEQNVLYASTPIPAQNKLPTIEIRAGQLHIQAELADSAQTRQTGLMGRSQLGNHDGMLFIFDEPSIQCMWMQNTLIDLDVAFLDEKGSVINIESMKAGTTNTHCSKQPAKQALEMNRGWFRSNHIGRGFSFQIPKH
jgi:uncharacterized membrane protein (UPF0127 family)